MNGCCKWRHLLRRPCAIVASAALLLGTTLPVAACTVITGSPETAWAAAAKKAQTVKITSKKAKMAAGSSYTIKVSKPADGGGLSFKSSDTAVATVTATGKVTAKKAGTAKITATAAATDKYKKGSASYTLTVKNNQTVKFKVELDDNGRLNVARNGQAKVRATTSGDGAIAYSSADPSLATVEPDGTIRTYGKTGSTTIFATAAETGTCLPGSDSFSLSVHDSDSDITAAMLWGLLGTTVYALETDNEVPVDLILDTMCSALGHQTDFVGVDNMNTILKGCVDYAKAMDWNLRWTPEAESKWEDYGIDTSILEGLGGGNNGGYQNPYGCTHKGPYEAPDFSWYYGAGCPCGGDVGNGDWPCPVCGQLDPDLWGCYKCGRTWKP